MFFLLTLLVGVCHSLEDTSPFNDYYTIPYYFGARNLERKDKHVLLGDRPTLFKWSHTYSYNKNVKTPELWIADEH